MADTNPADTNPDDARSDDMTADEKRRDQLLSAPNAVESDADPRIAVSERDGVTRIDILPDAAVRPGPGPGQQAEPAE